MKQRWRRLAVLGLTLCLALSILAMPAQAVQLETEDPADQIQAEETLAPAEEETQLGDEPETTEAENEDLALLPEENAPAYSARIFDVTSGTVTPEVTGETFRPVRIS